MADSKAFPGSRSEALALLYVQKAAVDGCTPENIADLYADALKRIKNRLISKSHVETNNEP